jgi:hypothetical protein
MMEADVAEHDWMPKAVAWLRERANRQEQTNRESPAHAQAYPSWTERIKWWRDAASDLERQHHAATYKSPADLEYEIWTHGVAGTSEGLREALLELRPMTAYGVVGSRDVDQARYRAAIDKALLELAAKSGSAAAIDKLAAGVMGTQGGEHGGS